MCPVFSEIERIAVRLKICDRGHGAAEVPATGTAEGGIPGQCNILDSILLGCAVIDEGAIRTDTAAAESNGFTPKVFAIDVHGGTVRYEDTAAAIGAPQAGGAPRAQG